MRPDHEIPEALIFALTSDGEQILQSMETLAGNLRVAGALCRAHTIGEGSGYEWATREPIWPRWEPGCGADAGKAEEARRQPGAFADIYGDRSKWRAP